MSVSLTINGHTTRVPPGETTLFEHAERLGVRVPTSCHRNGKCKECVVEIADGPELLSAPTASERHLKQNFRLACQARVSAPGGRVSCQTMRRGRMRIERQAVRLPAIGTAVPPDPCVRRDGADRILLDGDEIARSTAPIFGIAVDIGTTTVVVRLLNLETGEQVADAAMENPQRFGGSDVMSRIHYDTTVGEALLMRTLAGYLGHVIESFPVDPRQIFEAVVVGNTTMRDLFFRQDVYSIGQTPYQSLTELDLVGGARSTTSLVQSAARAMLPIHPRARVYGGPIISGHVGADAAACMLAVDLAHEPRLVAIMDIGTNTELIVGNRDRIVAASCPAGPAFEGGAISCGMPGLDGAIHSVTIDDADGSIRTSVIGGGAAEGICGSGLIDLLAELLRTGRMNEIGRFTGGPNRITLDRARQIHFLESDASALAQAKAAASAGLRVVFDALGVSFDAVDVFYLAGGFGRHLDVQASQRIGLIPMLNPGKFVQVGNAAIEGASIALLSRGKRQELEALARRVEHCRLESHPGFFDFFVDGCQFKPLASSPMDVR